MRGIKILCVIAVVVATTGCAGRAYMNMTKMWQMNNDQIITQLNEVNETRNYNFPAGYTLANVATAYDQNLFHVFNEHLWASCVVSRRWIIKDQAEWLEHRDKVLAGTAGEYEGGSLGPEEAAKKKIELTKERIRYYREK